MGEPGSAAAKVQRETVWRERMTRQAASGQSVAAFCRDEALAEATFYGWRVRRRGHDFADAATPPSVAAPAAFLDLGVVNPVRANALVRSALPLPSRGASAPTGIEIRLELGGGIVLPLARHCCSSLKARCGYSCRVSPSACGGRLMAYTP